MGVSDRHLPTCRLTPPHLAPLRYVYPGRSLLSALVCARRSPERKTPPPYPLLKNHSCRGPFLHILGPSQRLAGADTPLMGFSSHPARAATATVVVAAAVLYLGSLVIQASTSEPRRSRLAEVTPPPPPPLLPPAVTPLL